MLKRIILGSCLVASLGCVAAVADEPAMSPGDRLLGEILQKSGATPMVESDFDNTPMGRITAYKTTVTKSDGLLNDARRALDEVQSGLSSFQKWDFLRDGTQAELDVENAEKLRFAEDIAGIKDRVNDANLDGKGLLDKYNEIKLDHDRLFGEYEAMLETVKQYKMELGSLTAAEGATTKATKSGASAQLKSTDSAIPDFVSLDGVKAGELKIRALSLEKNTSALVRDHIAFTTRYQGTERFKALRNGWFNGIAPSGK